jgi:hypothetical protein
MVPTYFTVLDKLPLTPNGKIDWQQKLPLAVLFSSPTIAQLAQQLQQGNTQHTCLVPMQTQGSQPPLYCLPENTMSHYLRCNCPANKP